jgi:hypothetical protein
MQKCRNQTFIIGGVFRHTNNTTEFKSSIVNSTPSTKNNAPYSYLEDPEDVGPGKDFTAKQRQVIIEENMKKNNGAVLSDSAKGILSQPEKSMKGVTPSPDEWQIDHIIPKKAGGTNSYSNAQVLSRLENRSKWDK